MFLSKKSVRFVSAFIIAFMMVSYTLSMPLVIAADNNVILDTDFSDFTSSGGTSAPPGMNIFNSDAGKAQCLPASDDIYGNVARLSLTEESMKYLAIGKYVTPDSSKSFVVETVIKRHDISGSDFAIDLWSGGKQLIKFDKKGNLYFGDNTLIGAYEADVWYEVKIEYLASQKLLQVRINGGRYENTVVSKIWEQMAFTEFDFGMRNVADGLKSDVYIGYCRVFETAPFEAHPNIQLSFDNFNEGALSDSALSSNTSNYFFDSGFKCTSAHEKAFYVEEIDEKYGLSLAMDAVGGMNQFALPLKAPHIEKFENGVSYMDFSLRIGDNMAFYVIADGEGSDLISGKNGYFFPLYVGGNTSFVHVGSVDKEEDKLMFEWENNRWYDISLAFDMDSHIMTFRITDSQNPDIYAEKTRSIEGFTSITQLAAASGENSGDHTSSYIDNIRIYEEAPLEVFSISPSDGTNGISLSPKFTVNFNMPIDTDCVTKDNILLEGKDLTPDDYEVYTTAGNVVCIKPLISLSPETEYTLTVNPLTDIFGQTTENALVAKFVTSKFVAASTPVYSTDGSEKNMYTNVKFSDVEYRDLLVVYGIYDKEDGSLIDFNTFSAHRAEMNANLTVTIPENKEYYNEVMILNTYRSLRPYTQKFTDDTSASAKGYGNESVTLDSIAQVLTISGKAQSKGEVVVAVLNPQYNAESLDAIGKDDFRSAINYIRQLKTDDEGNFKVSYKISGTSGTYRVLLNYTDSETDASEIAQFKYFSPQEINEAFGEINNASDSNGIAAVLSEKSEILGFDMTVYSTLSDDGKTNSLKMFFAEKEEADSDNGFSNIAQAAASFKKCTVLSKFSETENAEQLCEIISGYADVIGISKTTVYKSYNKLADTDKLDVCQKILTQKPEGEKEITDVFCECAFVESVNSLPNWNGLNALIKDNRALLADLDISAYTSLEDTSTADKEIVSRSYDNLQDFCLAVNDIVVNLKYPSTSGGSSGGSYGGGFSGGSMPAPVVPAYPTPAVSGNASDDEKPTATETSFADMAGYEWANEAVLSLSAKGIINGKTKTEFCPGDLITREEFAKILVNAFSKLDLNASAVFSDVKEDDWYAPYVATAYAQNIVSGMGDGSFGAGLNITRQDMCVMAWRAAVSAGFAKSVEDISLNFTDAVLISDYAKDAVGAMYATKYITGMGNGEFAPLQNATRAQAAQIVYRIILDKEAK